MCGNGKIDGWTPFLDCVEISDISGTVESSPRDGMTLPRLIGHAAAQMNNSHLLQIRRGLLGPRLIINKGER